MADDKTGEGVGGCVAATLLFVGNALSWLAGAFLLIFVLIWVNAFFGFVWAVVSFFLAPISVIVVPIIAAVWRHQWGPIETGWGGILLGRIMAAIGVRMLRGPDPSAAEIAEQEQHERRKEIDRLKASIPRSSKEQQEEMRKRNPRRIRTQLPDEDRDE